MIFKVVDINLTLCYTEHGSEVWKNMTTKSINRLGIKSSQLVNLIKSNPGITSSSLGALVWDKYNLSEKGYMLSTVKTYVNAEIKSLKDSNKILAEQSGSSYQLYARKSWLDSIFSYFTNRG